MVTPISKEVERRIVQLLQAGDSYRKIAATCGVGYGTVKKIAQREFPDRVVKKTGRAPKLLGQEKRIFARFLTSGAKKTAVGAQKTLETDHGISVHVKIITQALHDLGLHKIKRVKKTSLSSKNVKARLERATLYGKWTAAD